MNTVVNLPDFDALRNHVLEILCARDVLDPSQTPLHQTVIKRRGRPCGLFFEVRGPRRVKNYAIWASAEGRILFYDGSGVRFAETRVIEGPEAKKVAA
jgi:hypothetical protein